MKSCNHPCCGDACRKVKPKKPRKRIRHFSVKRERLNREYSKARREFLKEGDPCEAKLEGCTGVAKEIHHRAGRVGKNLLDTGTWLKTCRSCHHWIETHPEQAKRLGLSESRLA
jgi:hypothetical protein